jgi:hypothetical protein
MIYQAVMLVGPFIAILLIIATVVVVQRDKQANRGRAQRADQILGALHDSAASGRPWRSIYRNPATRVPAGFRYTP